jgi:hypothetical protein
LADALITGAKKKNGTNGGEISSQAMAQHCFGAGLIRLSIREQGFVRDMINRQKASPKQLHWLKDIYKQTKGK